VPELVLRCGQAVRGRVPAEGWPIQGARGPTPTPDPPGIVSHAPLPRPMALRHAAAVAMDDADATTGSDGAFVATLHSDGWYTIAAEPTLRGALRARGL
jgi:hypothetical protein